MQRSLEDIFNAMYRGKWAFADFADGSIAGGYVAHRFTRQGKTRTVLSPSEKLRAHHQFLRLFVLDFLPVNRDVVFSYRKGVSAYDAVVRHAHGKHFFACDIADFFPSLSGERVRRTLVDGAHATPVADIERWIDRVLELICVDDALPIGFSTSPAISNAALRAADDDIQAQCVQRGLTYTRYSDDIVVSAGKAGGLDGIGQEIQAAFDRHLPGELALNAAKSRTLHRGHKVRLLGMVLTPNGDVTIDAAMKSEIEVLLHFFARDKGRFADKAGGDPQKGEARLSGMLNYANAVDQAYLDKLRRKFGATVVDMFLHRSFG